MKIRLFKKQDTEQVARLFHETVRHVNLGDYSFAQVQAWAPDNIYFRDWEKNCCQGYTYVAEDAGVILGFGELKPNGYIDCFYIHQDYQRCGVGSQIYQAIEKLALNLGVSHLTTQASITAKPFFLHLGFVIVKQQLVNCRGEVFINYLMVKLLNNK